MRSCKISGHFECYIFQGYIRCVRRLVKHTESRPTPTPTFCGTMRVSAATSSSSVPLLRRDDGACPRRALWGCRRDDPGLLSNRTSKLRRRNVIIFPNTSMLGPSGYSMVTMRCSSTVTWPGAGSLWGGLAVWGMMGVHCEGGTDTGLCHHTRLRLLQPAGERYDAHNGWTIPYQRLQKCYQVTGS